MDSNTENKCIIGIISADSSYDSSIFISNEETYYTNINYNMLSILTKYYNNEEINTTNSIIEKIINLLNKKDIFVMYRFICSSDCQSGYCFISPDINKIVYKFIKIATKNNVMIEFSDHSIGSLINNWDSSEMGMELPIELCEETSNGLFKIVACKHDFIESCHPILQKIGELSDDETISIKFNNMANTVVYSIKPDANVKLLSTGYPIKNNSNILNILAQKIDDDIDYSCNFKRRRLNSDDEKSEKSEAEEAIIEKIQPVHCEFGYQNGKFIISSTHWCNLEKVEFNVNVDNLKRQYSQSFGTEYSTILETKLSRATSQFEYNNVMSQTVRQISSGSNDYY